MAALGFTQTPSEEGYEHETSQSLSNEVLESQHIEEPQTETPVPVAPLSESSPTKNENATVNKRKLVEELAAKVAQINARIRQNMKELRYDQPIDPSPTSELTERDLHFKTKKNLMDLVAESAEVLHDDNSDDEFAEDPNRYLQPKCLTGGILEKHQVTGINWLIALFKSKCNGLLADQMGLGKTIQAMGLIAYLREVEQIRRRHLIICPLSVVENWRIELQHWIPDCKVGIFSAKKNVPEEKQMLNDDDTKFDIFLSSYDGLTNHMNLILKMKFHYFIIDEAQVIKNSNTKLAKAAMEVNCGHKLLLTGTPLSNSSEELGNLLAFLEPSIFRPNSTLFKTLFEERTADQEVTDGITREQLVAEVQKLTKPFILRRLKHDTEITLMPKKEVHLMCPLSKLQAETYKSLLIGNYNAKEGACKPVLTSLLGKLRQTSIHPYILKDIRPEMVTLEQLISDSGKFKVLDQIIDKFVVKEQIKVLIFSQMVQALRVVEEFLSLKNIDYYLLDGSTEVQSRARQIQEFNDPENEVRVFLLSTRAGGLGVNLKAASIVIILDSDWNPQVDMQAMDRAHRIGQEKEVRIYRLISKNTVEEKIIERQTAKLKYEFLLLERNRHKMIGDDAFSDWPADQTGEDQKETPPKYDFDLKKLKESELMDLAFFGVTSIIKADELGQHSDNIDIEKLLEDGVSSSERINEMFDYKVKEFTERVLEFNRENNYREFVELIEKQPELKLQPLSLDEMRVSYFEAENLQKQKEQRAEFVKDLSNFQLSVVAPQPHQFYRDPDRLLVLRTKSLRYQYCKFHQLKVEPSYLLTEAESAELDSLEKSGFGLWKTGDFRKFVKYAAKYGRYDLADIQTKLTNKTVEELYRYSIRFWSCLHYFDDALELQEFIRYHEYRRGLLELHQRKAQEILKDCSDPFYIDFSLQTQKRLKDQKLKGGASVSICLDRYILWAGTRTEDPDWGQILSDILADDRFSYTYIRNFLTKDILSIRFEFVLKHYLRQFDLKFPKFVPKETVLHFDFAKHFHYHFTRDSTYSQLEKEEIFWGIDQGFGTGTTTMQLEWFEGLEPNNPLGINLEPAMYWAVVELADKHVDPGSSDEEEKVSKVGKHPQTRSRKRWRAPKVIPRYIDPREDEKLGLPDEPPEEPQIEPTEETLTEPPVQPPTDIEEAPQLRKKRGRPRKYPMLEVPSQGDTASSNHRNYVAKTAVKSMVIPEEDTQEEVMVDSSSRIASESQTAKSSLSLQTFLAKRSVESIKVSQRTLMDYFAPESTTKPATQRAETQAELNWKSTTSTIAAAAAQRKERCLKIPDINSLAKHTRGPLIKHELISDGSTVSVSAGSGPTAVRQSATRAQAPISNLIIDEFDLEAYCKSPEQPKPPGVQASRPILIVETPALKPPRPPTQPPKTISISSSED